MSRPVEALKRVVGFNSSRARLAELHEQWSRTVAEGALVLDAGAGTAPYAGYYAHARYETLDFEKVDKAYGTSTYVADIVDIPVEDGRFDHVIFNQVMEHLPDPGRALAELRRVLRPGGTLLYTGPLFYEEHEQPFDFYRYTQYGLNHLFDQAGYEIERLEWLEGFFGTAAYALMVIARQLPLRPSHYRSKGAWALACLPVLLIRPAALLASMLLHRLELMEKVTSRGFPKNYVVIARRRG